MTKEELYNELKQDGAKLRPIKFYKLETLQSLYDERFGVPAPAEEEETETLPEDEASYIPDYRATAPEPEPEVVEIHTLYFTNGGWCNETGTSYQPGYYRPNTVAEYLALRKFAKEEL